MRDDHCFCLKSKMDTFRQLLSQTLDYYPVLNDKHRQIKIPSYCDI